MKSLFVIIAVGALAANVGRCGPDEREPQSITASAHAEHPEKRAAAKAGFEPISHGSKLLGSEVKNLQDTRLGKVDELALDLENGRVLGLIVVSDGVLGLGEKSVAIPPTAFAVDSDGKLRLDVTSQKIKAAPDFNYRDWMANFQPSSLAAARNYFPNGADANVKPAAIDPQVKDTKQILRCNVLIGHAVKNPQKETIGNVEDLALDLGAGKIAEVIVAAGGFLGIGEELNAIPPSAFKYDYDSGTLTLGLARDLLAPAPHFPRSGARQASQSGRLAEIYTYYQSMPYNDPTPLKKAETAEVRENPNPSGIRLDQGENQADIDLAAYIRRDISKQTSLSADPQRINVLVHDGRVTLRGRVETAEEKSILAEIANRYAPRDQLNNQVEVKTDANR